MRIDGLTRGSLAFCVLSILAFWTGELRVGAGNCLRCNDQEECVSASRGVDACTIWTVPPPHECVESGNRCC